MSTPIHHCSTHIRVLYFCQVVTFLGLLLTLFHPGPQAPLPPTNAPLSPLAPSDPPAPDTPKTLKGGKRRRIRRRIEEDKNFLEFRVVERDSKRPSLYPYALFPSYARISVEALEKFCQKTSFYCHDQDKSQQQATTVSPSPEASSQSVSNVSIRPGLNNPPMQNVSSDTKGEEEKHPPRNMEPRRMIATGDEEGLIAAKENKTEREENGTNSLDMNRPAGDGGFHPKSNSVLLQPHKHMELPPAKAIPMPSRRKKKKTCYVTSVGEAKSVGKIKNFAGAWMKDAHPKHRPHKQKRWIAEHFEGISIVEYETEERLKQGSQDKVIQLEEMYRGTNHVVYRNALYYHRLGTNKVVRFNLADNSMREKSIHGAAYHGGQYLYSRGTNDSISLSYMDFATDEHGVWVIYRRRNKGYLVVARLHPRTLKPEATWRLLNRQAQDVGNAFIVCGVLYVIDNTHASNATISWAYDLFSRRSARVDLEWRNKHGKVSMVNYDPPSQQLLVFDRGDLLTLPLNISVLSSPEKYF